MKFGRTYKLMIYSKRDNPVPDLTIEYPTTLRFALSNSALPTPNAAHFQIFNLGAETRAALYRDWFDMSRTYRGVVFAAGYASETEMPVVFRGDIQAASSFRQGPDWITEIDAYDGGQAIQQSQIDLTVPAGYELQSLIKQMVVSMDNVSLGSVGSFKGKSSRGRVLSGNTWDLLTRMLAPVNAQPFISKGVVHVVNQHEYISSQGALREISSETGLIGTPRRLETMIKATMIFEPRVEVGQVLRLRSEEVGITQALERFGDYKVMEVGHNGTISGTVGGDSLTTVTFYLGSEGLVAA